MTATAVGPGAWAFHPHPVSWAVAAAAAAGYLWITRRAPFRATGRQRGVFLLGCLLLAAALTWPLADLAARWSLTALVFQRLLLMLAVPALVLLGLPENLLVRATRPAVVDRLVETLSRPVIAVVVVTVVAVGTLSSGAVHLQATSVAGRALMDTLLLGAGFVLWLPCTDRVPGAQRPGALGSAAYLVVQSIVPSFLSIVWIFARHPLYGTYAHGGAVSGLSPLLDQQVAGFVAKLATIVVLWTVAFVRLRRAEIPGGPGEDDRQLTWADVERQLLRVERRERRHEARVPGMAPPDDGGSRPKEP